MSTEVTKRMKHTFTCHGSDRPCTATAYTCGCGGEVVNCGCGCSRDFDNCTCSMLIVCSWCQKELGTKPCEPEMNGETTHGLCDSCSAGLGGGTVPRLRNPAPEDEGGGKR